MENSSNAVPNRVFVGGTSWKANEKQLADFFSVYGKVVDCKIIMDKVTQKSKGYGFVTFENVEDANKVKRLNSVDFQGKAVNVGDAVRKLDSGKQGSQNYPFSPSYSPYYYDQPFYPPPSSPYYGSYLMQYPPPMVYPYDQTYIPGSWNYPYPSNPYANGFYGAPYSEENGEDPNLQVDSETNPPPNTDNSSSSNSNHSNSNHTTVQDN